mmetsp:Transcript_29039/g.94636  ORF Transcript_29039/g.94636 Transcript_29039/m.94636 type:complete len:215 (+) Transcript_29039:2797-3441(+)
MDATIGSVGWNTTWLTDPACPGSRYDSLQSANSQMSTMLSADPHATRIPFGDQLHLSRLFSNECTAPSKLLMQRDPATNGLTSQHSSRLSMPFESRYAPSGLSDTPVTVSVWASKVNNCSSFRMSHTLISLSNPPAYTRSPSAEIATAVIWYLFANVLTAVLDRKSHSMTVPSSAALASNCGPLVVGATLLTKESWPENRFTRDMDSVSHTATV